MAKAGRGDDQYMVRFPPGLRDKIKDIATANGWSMNNEIVDRLEASLDSWPHISLLPVVRRRASLFGETEREEYERALNRAAMQLALQVFPINSSHLTAVYRDISDLISKVEPSARQHLDRKARQLLEEIVDFLPENERDETRASYALAPRPTAGDGD